jgi:hypothetical protein
VLLCRWVSGSRSFETLCLFTFKAPDIVAIETKALCSSNFWKGLAPTHSHSHTSQDTQVPTNSFVRTSRLEDSGLLPFHSTQVLSVPDVSEGHTTISESYNLRLDFRLPPRSERQLRSSRLLRSR